MRKLSIFIKPLRGFNFLWWCFCYNYMTSTKSNKIKIVQVYKIISKMFDYCNDDGSK